MDLLVSVRLLIQIYNPNVNKHIAEHRQRARNRWYGFSYSMTHNSVWCIHFKTACSCQLSTVQTWSGLRKQANLKISSCVRTHTGMCTYTQHAESREQLTTTYFIVTFRTSVKCCETRLIKQRDWLEQFFLLGGRNEEQQVFYLNITEFWSQSLSDIKPLVKEEFLIQILKLNFK